MKNHTRSRRREDRAAGPAVLTNVSYLEQRQIGWDSERMRRAPGKAEPGPTAAGGEGR